MKHRSNKTRFRPALTMLEMAVAIAIMAIVFAVLVPQLRSIHTSWDAKAGDTEALQNGRILKDHLQRNLSSAARITAVSGPDETNGYIEFLNNDANSVRYDVNGITNYVQFGLLGNLADLAGPVSQLQFTCYNAIDLDTPITDVNTIRCVKVETTLTNSAGLGQDMTIATQAYIRTNALPAAGGEIMKMSDPWLEFDSANGMEPALLHMNGTKYLCAYRGDRDDGWACILTVNTGDWSVSASGFLEYDIRDGQTPALAKIDNIYFLCVYQGNRGDGFACILFEKIAGMLQRSPSFEFDATDCVTPALCKIVTQGNEHYFLCVYAAPYEVRVVVLKTTITDVLIQLVTEGPVVAFPAGFAPMPALAKIDDTHYLCVYEAQSGGVHGAAVVLTVDLADWSVTPGTHFDFHGEAAGRLELAKIDDTDYICSYETSNDGRATVLTVNPSDWTVTKTPGPDFLVDQLRTSTSGLCQIDSTNFLLVYPELNSEGRAVILTVNTSDWSISKGTPCTFEATDCLTPTVCQIDTGHYLCAYRGVGTGGFAGVLELGSGIMP